MLSFAVNFLLRFGAGKSMIEPAIRIEIGKPARSVIFTVISSYYEVNP